MDQRKPSTGGPDRYFPPPVFNSAITAYEQVGGTDSRYRERIIPEMSVQGNILQTRIRNNRNLGYIESRSEFSKLIDQSVRSVTARRMTDVLERETLAALAATNAHIRYDKGTMQDYISWREELRADAEKAKRSVDWAKKAADHAVKLTLLESDALLNKWNPSHKSIREVVDYGRAENRLELNDDLADGLCNALRTTVTAKNRVESVLRDYLPMAPSKQAPKGIRHDISMLMGVLPPTHPPVDIEATVFGREAEKRRTAWTRIIDDLKHQAKGEVRDIVLEQFVKVVAGEFAAQVTGGVLFLADSVVLGVGDTPRDSIAEWKEKCDAFVIRENKRDEYLTFLGQQRQIFSERLKIEQLKPQEANMLREALPITDAIMAQEQAEKEKNAKAKAWCERHVPEAAELLTPKRSQSHLVIP